MRNSPPTPRPLAGALLGSDAAHAVVFCRRGLSDAEADALIAWCTSPAAQRSLTLVKSPIRAARDVAFRMLLGCSVWVVYPVPATEPELRLRHQCARVRVRTGTRSRRSTWELAALVNGSLLHWV